MDQSEIPYPTSTLARRCYWIERFAKELVNFSSIEEMGPATIRIFGRRILELAVDIRENEGSPDPELRNDLSNLLLGARNGRSSPGLPDDLPEVPSVVDH